MKRDFKLPRPYPDPELYRSTFERGLQRFPERKENYDRYKRAARTTKVDYLPVKLDVENLNICNLRCKMCRVSTDAGNTKSFKMSFKDFQELIDQQYGLVEVKMQGLGEPLLHKEFCRMVRYLRDRDIWVRSTTNATVLKGEALFQGLLDSDICELQISIDGTTKATYEAIRRGASFEEVSENCRAFHQFSAERGWDRTRMWTVIQAGNYSELYEFPKFASHLGFKRLTLTLDLNGWRDDVWEKRIAEMDVSHQLTPEMVEQLVSIGREHGVEVTFWVVDEKFSTESVSQLCPWPFERLLISAGMRIVPCCAISTPEVMDLGDARHLSEEWNSEQMQEFRSLHLEGKIPEVCKACYVSDESQAKDSLKIIPN